MIQHVSLETRPGDVEPARAFWALLGFEQVDAPPGIADRAVWLQRGPTQVHLLLTDDPVAPPRGHVAVVADDYDGTLAALRDAGHEVEPRQEHWGAPRSYTRAPGAHRVELMAAPPPQAGA